MPLKSYSMFMWSHCFVYSCAGCSGWLQCAYFGIKHGIYRTICNLLWSRGNQRIKMLRGKCTRMKISEHTTHASKSFSAQSPEFALYLSDARVFSRIFHWIHWNSWFNSISESYRPSLYKLMHSKWIQSAFCFAYIFHKISILKNERTGGRGKRYDVVEYDFMPMKVICTAKIWIKFVIANLQEIIMPQNKWRLNVFVCVRARVNKYWGKIVTGFH